MTINRYIQLFILLSITAVGIYHLQQWRYSKLSGLSTPADVRFPAVVQASSDKTRVILFGDSRMAQWKASWPSQYDVINRGISGSTSFQALERLGRDVFTHQPDWVIIQIGINDVVASRLLFAEARKKAIDDIPNNIEKIVTEISNSGAKVILMSVVPDIDADLLRLLIWQGGLKSDVESINKKLQTIEQLNVIKLNMSDLFANNGVWKADYARDALHWNPNAYGALLNAALTIVER